MQQKFEEQPLQRGKKPKEKIHQIEFFKMSSHYLAHSNTTSVAKKETSQTQNSPTDCMLAMDMVES